VFLRTWDLGFTAFGGPAVHFNILHRRLVDGKGFGGGEAWVDEQTVGQSVSISRLLLDFKKSSSRIRKPGRALQLKATFPRLQSS
jgi:hypothetical protein